MNIFDILIVKEINNIIVLFNLPIIINPTKNELFKLTTPYGVRDGLRHAHSSYLKNVSAIKNGASHKNPKDQGGFTMRL
jgi:hypothetical protein